MSSSIDIKLAQIISDIQELAILKKEKGEDVIPAIVSALSKSSISDDLLNSSVKAFLSTLNSTQDISPLSISSCMQEQDLIAENLKIKAENAELGLKVQKFLKMSEKFINVFGDFENLMITFSV